MTTINVLAATLAVIALILLVQYSRLKWEESLEGWGTMLSILAMLTLAGAALTGLGTTLTSLALVLGVVVCVSRLISIRRGRGSGRNKAKTTSNTNERN